MNASLKWRHPARCPRCPLCERLEKAIALVQAQWIVAGIDLKDGEVSAPITGNENARRQPGEWES